MSDQPVGFIGLGSMGHVLATNLVDAGRTVVTHDLAGSDRAPDGSQFVHSAADVARTTDVLVFSLPDGRASEAVTRAIVEADGRRTTTVVDTSTIGVPAAEANAALLADVGVGYLDAPVSGGIAGARARTLTVMYAGTDVTCERAVAVLEGLSDRRVRVGDRPGLGQAMKLANNFLSASALVAASEAIAFGTSVGLSMATMLEVLDGASGQSNATSEKFPKEVLTERYAAGFANDLMAKDVELYLASVASQDGPHEIATVIAGLWRRFATEQSGADFTAIYPFVRGSS